MGYTKYIKREVEIDQFGNEIFHDTEVKTGYPKSYEKWGIDLVKAGYTLLPNHFININRHLSDRSKLNPTEMMVIIVILSNWWDPYKRPAASKKYLADRLNLSPRQIQRILVGLHRKGVIRKRSGNPATGGASSFDLSGLINILMQIAVPLGHNKLIPSIQLELDFHSYDNPSPNDSSAMYPET